MDTYKISEDGKSVTVSADGVDTEMTLDQVKQMVSFFGEIRSKLDPAVPQEWPGPDHSTPLQSLFVRHLSSGTTPSQHGALLVARSDQFGWFDFPITPEMCQGFAAWFLAQPEAINPPDGTILN